MYVVPKIMVSMYLRFPSRLQSAYDPQQPLIRRSTILSPRFTIKRVVTPDYNTERVGQKYRPYRQKAVPVCTVTFT